MDRNPMCEAKTRKGLPCPIHAAPGSLLCHVHDPQLQCGARTRTGKRCGVATGGVRCQKHPESLFPAWSKT